MADRNVEMCSGCPFCNYTRKATKETLWYKICRFMQNHCMWCKAANKKLGKNFQKSPQL
ncbi:MAG: hypothetical protein P9M07_05150 [Candidatus Aceula meridiana]|nr:hypothetical protein [Candidatus Aceula meridiana]